MTQSITTFDPLAALSGETLHIRALASDDFDGLFAIAADKELWAQHPEKNRYQREVFEKWFADAMEQQTLVIIDHTQNRIIGSSRYYEIEPEKSSVAIGYTFIGRDYWGGTTNAELKQLMFSHAFKHFETIWLHIGKDNLRSRKASEKIGARFSHDGEINGVPYCWYKITTSDYQSRS